MGKEHNISKANRLLGDTTYFRRLDPRPNVWPPETAQRKTHWNAHLKGNQWRQHRISCSHKSQSRSILSPPHNSQTWQPWRPKCLCKRSPSQTDLRVCRPTSLVFRLPSYVQETTDYLTELSPSDISEETLLVSLDVVSLYTNIPHKDGIEACRKVWNTRETMDPPTKSLVDLLTLVLKYYIFEFNGDHYL